MFNRISVVVDAVQGEIERIGNVPAGATWGCRSIDVA